jgi:hypothetical protein
LSKVGDLIARGSNRGSATMLFRRREMPRSKSLTKEEETKKFLQTAHKVADMWTEGLSS